MRKCCQCQQIKPLSDFYKRSAVKNGYQSMCKTCNKNTRTELTRKNRRLGIELLGGKCSRCGYSKYDGALHFHHPESQLKDRLFHRLRNREWDYIRETLLKQKCVLLCANCHAEEHRLI